VQKLFRVYSCGYSSGIEPDSLLILVKSITISAAKIGQNYIQEQAFRLNNPENLLIEE